MKTLTLLLLTLFLATPATADETELRRALTDELTRSMERLQIEGLDPPYYLGYYAYDLDGHTARASLGSIIEDGPDDDNLGYVELRVGTPQLDNSNFFRASRSRVLAFRLPLTTDYDALRRTYWIETDTAYKDALEILAKKTAALRSKTREDVPDFVEAEAQTLREDPLPEFSGATAVRELAQRLSARLREFPALHRSEVQVSARNLTTVLVSSDGADVARREPRVSIDVLAVTQAEDGMELRDGFSLHARDFEGLPRDLDDRVDAVGTRLTALITAPLVEQYNGPVWFSAEAAAKLFAQKFAPALLNQRRPVLENERFDPFSDPSRAPLQNRIGGRVLPRPVEVVDDPTRREFDGAPLLGQYPVDDDGVAASPTQVVRRGRLRTLLSTRNPSAQVSTTTGNRRGGQPMPSNLIFRADETQNEREFRKEFMTLLDEAELEYGIVVRGVSELILRFDDERGRFDDTMVLTDAVMLHRDGTETAVRNLTLPGFGASGFRDLIAIGKDPAVVHSAMQASPVSFGRLPSIGGPRLFSVVAPAMLFEELSLRKPESDAPTLPALPSPSR